jgi:hypothetical protein
MLQGQSIIQQDVETQKGIVVEVQDYMHGQSNYHINLQKDKVAIQREAEILEASPPIGRGGLEGAEWLETNGLGGWSGSTIIGCNTRGYHGLLIAATKPRKENRFN